MAEDLRDIDEMISDEDYKAMMSIARVKRQLTSYFDKKKLLDEMIKIIEAAPCMDFSSDRSKKFIDANKPVFKLRLSMPKAIEMYSKELGFRDTPRNTDKEIVGFRMSVIHKEVVSPFSELLRAALKDVDPAMIPWLPEDLDLAKFIVSSIFQVKTELEEKVNPVCYVEYTI